MTISSPRSTAAGVAGHSGVITKASHATQSMPVSAAAVADPPVPTELTQEVLENLTLSTATTLKERPN
jgi:hypothetical protein